MATPETDSIAPLIAWHATERLRAEERARVEEHLPACDACRELLATARGFRRLAPGVSPETILGHVQAQLLVEYADDPGSLELDTRRLVASHLASCRVCGEAVEILEDLGSGAAGGAPATEPAGPARRAWRWITRTFLRPLPALAYLAALVALLVASPLREPARDPARSRPAVSVLPRAAVLPEELVARGTGDAAAPPIEVPLRAGQTMVLLELVTSIETERMRDPHAAFHIAIAEGQRLVFESVRRGTDFEPSGRLRLALDPGALAPGRSHTVRLTFVKPGDPLDGEEVFRRSFRLVPQTPPPS